MGREHLWLWELSWRLLWAGVGVKRLYLALKGREVFAQLKDSRREKIIFLMYN